MSDRRFRAMVARPSVGLNPYLSIYPSVLRREPAEPKSQDRMSTDTRRRAQLQARGREGRNKKERGPEWPWASMAAPSEPRTRPKTRGE